MIHNSKTVFEGLLLLVLASASASASASSDLNAKSLSTSSDQELSRSLRDSGHSNDTRSIAQGRLVTTVSEAYPCIPPEEIKLIHEDPTDNRLPWGNGASGAIQKQCYLQQNHCGFSSAPSACCRISFEAGWLVCDAFNAFDFMPCVCNDNTFGSPTPQPTASKPPTSSPTDPPTTRAPTGVPTEFPTSSPTRTPTLAPTASPTSSPSISPTAPPTISPTVSPTVPPTAPPTAPPTVSPTVSPTVDPTQTPTTGFVPTGDAIVTPISSPTLTPTNTPVANPTAAPVVITNTPTGSPTKNPTLTPTASPTEPPVDAFLERYRTENKFDADLDATIRQSQCVKEPPVVEFVQGTTFVYRYEVSRLEALASSERTVAGTIDTGSAVVGAGVNGRLGDTVSNAIGSGLTNLSNDWMETLHNELAAEFLVCDGFDFDTVWILQSKPHLVDLSVPCSGGSSKRDDYADSNDSSPSCVSVTGETRIIAYSSPLGKKTTKQLWADTTYNQGDVSENFAKDAIAFLEDRLNGSFSGDGLLAPTFDIVFAGGEIVDDSDKITEGDNDDESNNDNGSDDSGTDSEGGDNPDSTGDDEDTTTGPAIGIEASNSTNSPTGGRLTPGVVATIAVVASCLLIILMLAVLRQRHNRKPREDEEFLQDLDSPKSDYYTGRPVDHLDLSVSSHSSDEPGPIVRSDLDLEENKESKMNHRGRSKKSTAMAMASKTLSPKHFQFSGFVSGVPSPRERSRMGPLNLADEFQESSSNRTSFEETTTGNHRGVISNSSSMSSNHRGIVTNSSSMSSNLPPPHQNTSPRLYQLRDTVKL